MRTHPDLTPATPFDDEAPTAKHVRLSAELADLLESAEYENEGEDDGVRFAELDPRRVG